VKEFAMLPYPPDPDEPITAVCAATYYADLIPAHAFVFRVPSTRTRFTVYAADADRYRISQTYTLTLTPVEDRRPAAPTKPPSGGDPASAKPPADPEGDLS